MGPPAWAWWVCNLCHAHMQLSILCWLQLIMPFSSVAGLIFVFNIVKFAMILEFWIADNTLYADERIALSVFIGVTACFEDCEIQDPGTDFVVEILIVTKYWYVFDNRNTST